ncbi:hypothetical protein DFH08DRAFT_800661 [Mycena albidolilacea]|uniref:Uncharacterized protein n=1 Tax=Mycena albidolilacea TaxID=1033008 RepID=A0AAD7EZS5_9AGAR|nr:hypothetical protein DFH08DRAFT_800661 [Mycena albidolilacea]
MSLAVRRIAPHLFPSHSLTMQHHSSPSTPSSSPTTSPPILPLHNQGLIEELVLSSQFSDTTTESSAFLSVSAAASVAATGSVSAHPAAPNLTPRGHINRRVRTMSLPSDPRFPTRSRRVIPPPNTHSDPGAAQDPVLRSPAGSAVLSFGASATGVDPAAGVDAAAGIKLTIIVNTLVDQQRNLADQQRNLATHVQALIEATAKQQQETARGFADLTASVQALVEMMRIQRVSQEAP